MVIQNMIRSQRTKCTVGAMSDFRELMVKRKADGQEDTEGVKQYEAFMNQNGYNQEMQNQEQLIAEKRAQKQDQAFYEEEVQQRTEYKQQEETHVGKEEKK